MDKNLLFLVNVWDVTPLGLLNNDLHYKKANLNENKSYHGNNQRTWEKNYLGLQGFYQGTSP